MWEILLSSALHSYLTKSFFCSTTGAIVVSSNTFAVDGDEGSVVKALGGEGVVFGCSVLGFSSVTKDVETTLVTELELFTSISFVDASCTATTTGEVDIKSGGDIEEEIMLVLTGWELVICTFCARCCDDRSRFVCAIEEEETTEDEPTPNDGFVELGGTAVLVRGEYLELEGRIEGVETCTVVSEGTTLSVILTVDDFVADCISFCNVVFGTGSVDLETTDTGWVSFSFSGAKAEATSSDSTATDVTDLFSFKEVKVDPFPLDSEGKTERVVLPKTGSWRRSKLENVRVGWFSWFRDDVSFGWFLVVSLSENGELDRFAVVVFTSSTLLTELL